MQRNSEKQNTGGFFDEISKIESGIDFQLSNGCSCHKIELDLMAELVKLGRIMLAQAINTKAIEMDSGVYLDEQGASLSKKGIERRSYLSLFGPIEIVRQSYWNKYSGKVYALDEALQLPVGTQWSYNLQEMVGAQSTGGSYDESVCLLNRLLGLNLSGKSSARNAGHLGTLVEGFYAQEQVTPNASFIEEPVVYMSASLDGKGVPMIRTKEEEKGENPKRRLAKGEKNGATKAATVVVTSHFIPKQRTKEDVLIGLGLLDAPSRKPEIKGLDQTTKDGRWHENIHRRGFLDDQAKAVRYGISLVKANMGNKQSRFVVPIDAGSGLEEKVLKAVEEEGLQSQLDAIILDIIHVSEYVWASAAAIFGEKSKCRQPWVKDVLSDLLDSKVDKVIDDLLTIGEKTDLSDSKFEQLCTTVNYFINHQHKMDYKKYLEKGYPISSAMAESTCKHLVKDRMATSGTRWDKKGAQHMLDLRATYINNNMQDFMAYVIAKEHEMPKIKVA